MKLVRKNQKRGSADYGWLKTFHTFSFANYFDPEFMGYRTLRVINEDFVSPLRGFDTHGHRDMEIITVVLSGQILHKDTLGNEIEINSGDIQRMSAGTGIMHSEFNNHPSETLHLLQIWIEPNQKNLKPSYEQKNFLKEQNEIGIQVLVQPFINNTNESFRNKNAISIHQDAFILHGKLEKNTSHFFEIKKGRGAWIQVIKGNLKVEFSAQYESLASGDAFASDDEETLILSTDSNAQFLVFDLK